MHEGKRSSIMKRGPSTHEILLRRKFPQRILDIIYEKIENISPSLYYDDVQSSMLRFLRSVVVKTLTLRSYEIFYQYRSNGTDRVSTYVHTYVVCTLRGPFFFPKMVGS